MRAFERLQDNVSLNGLRNVRAFRIALGEEQAESRLYVGQRICPSLLARTEDYGDAEPSEIVQVANGDEIWNAHGLPVPDAAKIDVEGFEYSVLRGLGGTLSDSNVKLLLCEIHPQLLPNGTSADKVRELITALGFSEAEIFLRTTEVYVVGRK